MEKFLSLTGLATLVAQVKALINPKVSAVAGDDELNGSRLSVEYDDEGGISSVKFVDGDDKEVELVNVMDFEIDAITDEEIEALFAA